MNIAFANRDFQGYGENPPNPMWPGNARVAVSFVVNFEEGSEASLSIGDARNEKVYEVTDEVIGVPDRCMESHYEYGTKAGYWRIVRVFEKFGIKATFSTCGFAAEISPWLIRDAAGKGHEISCHGWRWEKHANLSEDEERLAIARTVETIQRITGTLPVGWHTRSTPSTNTRRLLTEHGGFIYDSDDYGDDLPFYADVSGHHRLVVPYAFDTNDMHYHFGYHRFVSADDFADYVIEAFDQLWEEGEISPKMLSIGLHLRIVGRPGRIGSLTKMIGHMQKKGEVWFARREDIARHWLSRFPPDRGQNP
jgi:peptidoglycan/xylan/chitin deacetylase (PgdA/CDA1 family)